MLVENIARISKSPPSLNAAVWAFFEIGNVTENHEVFCGKDLDLLPDWRTLITPPIELDH